MPALPTARTKRPDRFAPPSGYACQEAAHAPGRGHHLQEFTLTGQTRLCPPDRDQEIEGEITEDYQRVKLSRLRPGEQFVYVFDLKISIT